MLYIQQVRCVKNNYLFRGRLRQQSDARKRRTTTSQQDQT